MGEIGHGWVYRAEETRTGTEVELIALKPQSSWTMSPADSGALDRLWDQLSRARDLNHPNISSVKAMGMVPEGTRYVALELLQGELLSEIVRRQGVLSLEDAAELMLQAASGLEAAHGYGVIHGSLSPDSILVTHTFDDRPLVKLIRFGTGPQFDYSAPEQRAGQREDQRGDIFSLGAVLHYLLSGQPPGAGSEHAQPIPEAVRPVVSRALEPLPERRFLTVASFARALAAAKDEEVAEEEEERGEFGGGRIAAIAAGFVIVAGALWWLTSPEPVPVSQPATVTMAAQNAQVPDSTLASDTSSRTSARPTRESGAPANRRAAEDGEAPSTRPPARNESRPAVKATSPPVQGPRDSALGYVPMAPTEPPASLTDTPAMRLALGDVTRLDIITAYEEVRPGRLVLVVGDGYWNSQSVSYNLRQLYAAYVQLLKYPRQSPVMELWSDGRKIGEYTRGGLNTESAQPAPP